MLIARVLRGATHVAPVVNNNIAPMFKFARLAKFAFAPIIPHFANLFAVVLGASFNLRIEIGQLSKILGASRLGAPRLGASWGDL